MRAYPEGIAIENYEFRAPQTGVGWCFLETYKEGLSAAWGQASGHSESKVRLNID